MLKKGTRVARLTKRVGQPAATGRIIDIRPDQSYEIKWDDGHVSVTSPDGVIRVKREKANR